mmetsp:Transcript_46548/g.120119  ORF Transcript_46548/g.120119 Transcript_46548/m.120119 type:complete len:137 (-) Transcript_46548:309-719(-)
MESTGEQLSERERLRHSDEEDTVASAVANAHAASEKLVQHTLGLVTKEFDLKLADLDLLRKMNDASKTQYSTITDRTRAAVDRLFTLRAEQEEIAPELEKIDKIHASAVELENVAKLLDDYTKQLKARFEASVLKK